MGISESNQGHSSVKQELRSALLLQRLAIFKNVHHQHSTELCALLVPWLMQRLNHFDRVFAFLSYKGEPDLLPFLKAVECSVTTALPVVGESSNAMDFYHWKRGDPLVQNRFGILEPQVSARALPAADAKTLILVPALAISLAGFRLGFGGGFYDAYLKQHPGVVTMGIIFHEFLRHDLPMDPWDIRVHNICTEQQVITCA